MGRLVAAFLLAGTIAAAADAPVFSHKLATHSKLPCATCHPGAFKADRAGFPKITLCQGCHANFTEATLKLPSHRIYKLADFVIFSHSRHTGTAKVDCARCHGPVRDREKLTAEVSHNMIACVNCHKETHATITCTACHELGQ